MDIRQLLLLCPTGRKAYLAYDSFTRANADALGYTEKRGPLGLARLRLPWTTIGGDFDIAGNLVIGGDAQANPVLNPGFETGGTGGDFNGGAEVDDGISDDFPSWTEASDDLNGDKAEATATQHAGNYALKLTRATALAYIHQGMAVTAGRLYRYSFWTRGDGAQAGRHRLYDATNTTPIIDTTTTGVAGAVYTLVSCIVAAPTLCTLVRIYFYTPAANGVAYFDDISLLECHAEYINPGQADVVFRADLTTPAADTNPAGFILRRNGATQWLVQVTPGTAGTDFQLIELNNGVPTVRASADRDFAINTTYRIAVALTGQSIKVYQDGVERLSCAAAAVGLTNTQFGIWDSANANFSFDTVELWCYDDYPHAEGYG